MLKRKLYQSIILCGFLVIMLFGSHFANSETTQDDQCWGILRDTYTYIHDFDYYNYEKEDPLTKISEEITFWDVKSEVNNISFRTDLAEIFLGMVNCESEECYDEYRDAWEYDSVTDSFEVTYSYDNVSQKLGFIDPLDNESNFLGFNADIPLDPVKLGIYLFNYWGGLGFTFLPVSFLKGVIHQRAQNLLELPYFLAAPNLAGLRVCPFSFVQGRPEKSKRIEFVGSIRQRYLNFNCCL